MHVRAPGTDKFKGQSEVYNDMGKAVLENALKGFNACLFAYGQTGSGKSFSIVGEGPKKNPGILPRFCQELFLSKEKLKQTTGEEPDFMVKVGMIEIYNEKIFDLNIAPSERPKESLKIRESKVTGIYVDGLTEKTVNNYAELQRQIDNCTKHRTIAATSMNASSSRAHTVTMIYVTQKIKKDGQVIVLNPVINIIDLAGSERSDKTGATGDRLTEGCNINKGLMILGKVISTLAEQAVGKSKGLVVPYRESSLTRVLQNALGGNSVTSMIAAISPASDNFDETISTLKYADQVKKIKNNAVVNETPEQKLIRSLKQENDELKKMLAKGGGGANADTSPEEKEELKKQLEQQQLKMSEIEKSFEDRLKEALEKTITKEPEQPKSETKLHLTNLNEDPQLSFKINHAIEPGTNIIGKLSKKNPVKIPLSGLGILDEHCKLENNGKSVILDCRNKNAKVVVNGKQVSGKVELHHEDRILFGQYNYFMYIDPSMPTHPEYDWEFASNEVNADQIKSLTDEKSTNESSSPMKAKVEEDLKALENEKFSFAQKSVMMLDNKNLTADEAQKLKSGIDEKNKMLDEEETKIKLKASMQNEDSNRMKMFIESTLTKLIPRIDEINEITNVIKRPLIKFKATVGFDISKDGSISPKIIIKAFPDITKDYFNELSVDQFYDRYFIIKEKYDEDQSMPGTESEIHAQFGVQLKNDYFLIGKSFIPLKFLHSLLDLKEQTAGINSAQGQSAGEVKYSMVPLNEVDGAQKDLLEFDNIEELLGKTMNLEFTVHGLRGLPIKLANYVFAKYYWIDEEAAEFKTEPCNKKSQNPDFEYKISHKIKITPHVIYQIKTAFLVIESYGKPFVEEQKKDNIAARNPTIVNDTTIQDMNCVYIQEGTIPSKPIKIKKKGKCCIAI